MGGHSKCRRCGVLQYRHAVDAPNCVFQARLKALSASQSFSAVEIAIMDALVSGVMVGSSGKDLAGLLRSPAGSNVIRKINSMVRSVRARKAAASVPPPKPEVQNETSAS
jgi:hypothetical protein